MTRFLHTSDWQLGMTRKFLSAEAQGRFTQARIDAIRSVGRLAREHGAGFVVVAGDVFEDNQVARQTVQRACDALGEIAVPVFLLPGNHDPLDAGSVFRRPPFTDACPPHVTVLEDEEPRAVPGLEDVEVLGAPWRGKHPGEDLVGRALDRAGQPAGRRVVLGHGIVDSLDPDRDRVDSIAIAALERAIDGGHAHYVALGDRHSTTRVGDSGAVWYSGAPEATDFDEVDPGNVLLVELGDGVPEVRSLPVGRWRFEDVDAELDDDGSLAAFEKRLRSVPTKECTVLRLALRGSLDVAQSARLERLLDELRETFASLRTWERHHTLVVRTGDVDPEQLGLGGYARAAWERLAEEASGGDAEAEAALLLMHRLATEVAQ